MPAPEKRPLLKPPPLRPGETIGIIAPASNVDRAALERGCEALRRLGYKTFYFDSILERDLYFAGSTARRAEELHQMFKRDDIRAIICARGGYGCNYLLEHLDLDLIRKHPKILCGYSDVTSLLTYLHDAVGLVTFHGPMVTQDFETKPRDAESLWPVGVHPRSWQVMLAGDPGDSVVLGEDDGMIGLIEGEATGPLYGGCLSILVTSLGTPYEIKLPAGAIMFLEDIGEKPYQIDRMLMQLSLAGKFDGIRGFVFGQMLQCVQQPDDDQAFSSWRVVTRVLRERCPGVPVASGLRFGHVTHTNVTLPLGIEGSLRVSGDKAELTISNPQLPSEMRGPASAGGFR